MTETLILLGSNIEGATHLQMALARLDHHPDILILGRSRVYFSPSIGADGRPDGRPPFYNMAVRAETKLAYPELRTALRAVESDMGRVRTGDKFAPRIIDLDIEFFGENGDDPGAFEHPDPDATEHAHIALPLADIAPTWIHPRVGLPLEEIALRLTNSKVEIQTL